MARIVGLGPSFAHSANGMTLKDMIASGVVADRLNEVIIFRSTGPWSKRWLEREYPSKNFHVKGKSSDWGPHAGLVPRNGLYSKVGWDAKKAQDGTDANTKGIKEHFANEARLMLTLEQILEQVNKPEGDPPRKAIDSMFNVPDSKDIILIAKRSGDGKKIAFRAFKQADELYEIRVYPPGKALVSAFSVLDKDPDGLKAEPFYVMISNEIGALRPMTGDYDLMSVCPSWAAYGSQSPSAIRKDGIHLNSAAKPFSPGQTFEPGVGMDNVMDTRLHTMGKSRADAHLPLADAKGGPTRKLNITDFHDRRKIYADKFKANQVKGRASEYLTNVAFGAMDNLAEHGDMGNLTPRILRCINELNTQMGAVGDKAPLRRVHHNAESHRSRTFKALTQSDMTTMKDGDKFGDGFPLTVFQPASLYSGKGVTLPTAIYGDVSTLETLADFILYAKALKDAGFFVPKNWIWGI